MSERSLINTTTASIHLQDLEFEKKLKTLIQKIRTLYHTPESTLNKLTLIISRNQQISLPTITILRKLNQLFDYDTELISYITKELDILFPHNQNRRDYFTNTNIQSSFLRFNPELKARLIMAKNKVAKLDSSGIGSNSSNYNRMDSGATSYVDSEIIVLDSTDESNSTNGTIYDSDDSVIESNIRANHINISDIRSAPIRPAPTPSAPIRRRPTTHMTLESESLLEILQPGDHNLASDIYQHIGQYSTFQSFLELLNMYDSHLINHVELLQRLVPFLGRNKPLLDRFERSLMHDRTDNSDILSGHPSDNHAISSLSTSPLDPSTGDATNDTDAASDVSTISSHLTATRTTTNSPSYRWIPKSLRNENCPGRDDTCWNVLNDEYVSHPTWASEDNGFLSSNKSKYEEMLHLVEDERYALDIDISIMSDVLSIMEKYLQQIMDLPRAQRSKMKLTPEKDGCSTALYTQAIKKVYPKEKRKDAVNRLHTCPFEMLPEFVKLMKQRQSDLQKQKLEKIRHWKDTVAKHYHKFLDYHWGSHKSDARKTLTIQNLVNEIDALWHEQQRLAVLHQQRQQSRLLSRTTAQTGTISPDLSMPTLSPPQLIYSVDDSIVICDVLSLMRISCNHQFQYNSKALEAIELFLSEYLTFFLGLPPGYWVDDQDTNITDTSNEDLVAIKTRSHGRHRRLRLDSRRHPERLVTLEQRVFIGNTNWYCMTRYFQMIYGALAHLKSIDRQYQKSPKETKRNVSASLDLGLESKPISSVIVDLTQGYYNAALEITKACIRGDLEQVDLEEGIRYIFGIQAHVTFNIAKTLICLIRQIHQIMLNGPLLDNLYSTFKKYQPCQLEDMHSILGYRYEMDNILEPDDNRFIMAIDGRAGQLTLQILGQHEAAIPRKIRDYIDYVLSYQQRKRKTVGVSRKVMDKVFLNRNLEHENDRAISKIFLQPNIKYEIDPKSYHIHFTEGTEDVFVRQIINSKKRKLNDLDGDDDTESA